jgi:hypothetical protein
MERQFRYLVMKHKDLSKYLTDTERDVLMLLVKKVSAGRADEGKPWLKCVVVESDWPEYDETWEKIAARVDAENGQPDTLRSRLDQIEKYGVSPV